MMDNGCNIHASAVKFFKAEQLIWVSRCVFQVLSADDVSAVSRSRQTGYYSQWSVNVCFMCMVLTDICHCMSLLTFFFYGSVDMCCRCLVLM